LAELRGGVPDGDYRTFLGAMALSLLTSAAWSAIDARRAPTSRVLIRWLAVAFILGGGLGVGSTLAYPGGPPAERAAEAVWLSVFYGVPLLVAAGIGVAIGTAHGQPRRRHEDIVGTGA
jgi:hypothetical protein